MIGDISNNPNNDANRVWGTLIRQNWIWLVPHEAEQCHLHIFPYIFPYRARIDLILLALVHTTVNKTRKRPRFINKSLDSAPDFMILWPDQKA